MNISNIIRILIDGATLALIASLFIVITLRINPRIWLNDYPKDIRAKVPPQTSHEKRISLLLGLPFILLLVGFPFVSSLTLKQEFPGQAAFSALFINSFGVIFIFNLADWLLLDWLVFCIITPAFIVLEGTEGMPGYKNFLFHFQGFITGTFLSITYGLIAAAIISFL
jgi:hypothetical protein